MHHRFLSVLISFLALASMCVSTSAQQVDCAPKGSMAVIAAEQPGVSPDPGVNGVAGQWTTAPSLLTAKCFPSAAWLDGHLYVFGGGDAKINYDTKCYKLNALNGLWSAIAPLPIRRVMSIVQTVNGKIYIIGGHSALTPTFTVQAPVLEYDPVSNTYTAKASTPTPVFGAGSFVHDGRIFVLGGGTTALASSSDLIQIYDPASDLWTVSTSQTPYAALTPGVAAVDTTALFVGGVRYVGTQGTFGAWAYRGTIAGDNIVWTQIADYPDGSVMRFSAGSDGSKMYFSSGHNSGSQNGGPPSGKTFSYNPVSDTWTMMDQKPTPVYYSSQMIFDGNESLYMVGGYDAPSHVTAAVEALNVNALGGPLALFGKLSTDTWLKLGGSVQEDFSIRNDGSVPLTWEATVVPPAGTWLSLATTTGSLLPGETAPISAVLNSAAGNGDHIGKISVTTNDPAMPMTELTVTVHVQTEDTDEPTNVLVEQYTGTWCQWCPYGADSLAVVAGRFGDRVVRTSWHDNDPMQISQWEAMDAFIGVSGFPTASINRIKWPAMPSIPVSRTEWGNFAGFVVNNLRSPIGIDLIDKVYDPATKNLSFKVKVFFHRSINADLRLNVVMTENGLNYEQVKYTTTGNIRVNPYYHQAVVRAIYPDVMGMPLGMSNTFTTQSEIVKEFSFTSPHTMDDSTQIVVYVHKLDGTSAGPVQQAYSEPLMMGVTAVSVSPTAADFALRQNYPNPFNPSTNITFAVPQRSEVTIKLSDALGRPLGSLVSGSYEAGSHTITFDGSELTSGNYFLTMISGDVVLTRTMTLLK